ncbi:protease inhibitor I42 family protein [Mycobacterium heidelbergense]|uniref:protease inhibitor I42 family protein n=1 Tax=Mycobacterium heidelbergense TaxID=53376 RepID=UPI003CEDBE89
MKIRLLVTVAMLVTSTLVGCTFQSRNPPTSTTLEVSMDDVLKQSVITQNTTLAVGNTLTLKLGSNYTTPYRWRAETKIGDPTILKQTSHAFVQPTSDALGAPGTEVWTFEVLKPGITTITTYYTSFVGHDPTPKCTYNATVTVR